jgi:prevent-host-death family protein
MSKLPNMVPVTDLRQDATSILKKATTSRQPIIITQRGRAAAVLVSVEAYEHSQHEREILRLLARGEKEIKAGKGHELAAVLAEADELLKGE